MIRSDRLLIDLSQFVAEPYSSGVQRVLHGLLPRWRHDIQPADVGFEIDGWVHVVPTEAAAQAIDLLFHPPAVPDWSETHVRSTEVKALLLPHVTLEIPRKHTVRVFGGYLLPEPSYRSPVLDTLEDWLRVRPERTQMIVYDALPQLEPWAFAGPSQVHTSRYFRLVSQGTHLSAISASTLRQFERLAHRSLANARVDLPGADALGRRSSPPPPVPTIVVPGTIEPRKRIDLVIDAVEECWRRGVEVQLVCIGKAGWADEGVMDRVRSLESDEPRFRWLRDASDRRMASEVRAASAVVYLSEHEGYGLPPLEALALGCPVIASRDLPLFEHIAPDGQIRLDVLTPETVADAITSVISVETNQQLRRAAASLSVPTWGDYAESIASWSAEVMGEQP